MAKNLTIILLFSFFMGCKTPQLVQKLEIEKSINKIKPAKLEIGDTVGLIAPGSYISRKQLDESINNLEELGYKVKYNDEILDKYGYLAGKDSVRVKEIHSMFLDKEIKAIMAVRGGYGCARFLQMLDYELIRNNPKIIIGYSDLTSLLYGIYKKSGLVCFHGPVGTSTFNDYSINNMLKVIADDESEFTMTNLPDDETKIKVIKAGVAEGELVGGNLSIVVSMIGTDYDIDSENKIIFLEDIGEEPYRIDRMLTQMIQSGKFENCSGIALGVFRKCEIDKDSPEFENSLTLQQMFQDRLGNLGVPVIYGLSFGHITNKFTLPFGINAKLDTYNKKLVLLENSVE